MFEVYAVLPDGTRQLVGEHKDQRKAQEQAEMLRRDFDEQVRIIRK